MSAPTEGIKVELYKLKNRLKDKLGLQARPDDMPGYIDPKAIAEADKMIESLCVDCPDTIAGQLEELAAHWTKMKEMERSPDRDALAQEIFTIAHEIKDMGSMCGYGLAAYFAESLRDFVESTELKLDAQRVIIQAHIDALQVVIKKEMRDEGGPAAEELKEMVKIAVDKYR